MARFVPTPGGGNGGQTGRHEIPAVDDVADAAAESERANQNASIAATAAANAVADVLSAVAHIHGEQGEQGEQGEPGEQGEQGRQGFVGARGQTGKFPFGWSIMGTAWKVISVSVGILITILGGMWTAQMFVTRSFIRAELKTVMADHNKNDHAPLQETHDNVIRLTSDIKNLDDKFNLVMNHFQIEVPRRK